MLRKLQQTEIQNVSGGTIIVTGDTGMNEWELQSILDRLTSTYMINAGISFVGGSGGTQSTYPVVVQFPDPNDDPNADDDGDGILNGEDTITVNGPPRMADDWSDLSLGQRAEWLAAFFFSNGNDQYADIVTGTDLSGKNPSNPYQSQQEAEEDYADLAKDGLKSIVEAIP